MAFELGTGEEILNQFNDGTGKQVTANEIKTVLDEACGKGYWDACMSTMY